MHFGFTDKQQSFIEEIREFCATTPEGELSEIGDTFPKISLSFFRKVCSKGWAGLTFPREYGGRGLSEIYRVIFNEEMESFGVPVSVISMSNNLWLGGMIAKHGTEQQKNKYLNQIIKGDIILFSQCFTEPDAGSDLVSIKTRAILDGDDYVINGQKTFHSHAHLNSKYVRLMLMARTDPNAHLEKGISLFILPVDLPGMTIMPLWTNGAVRTNEVFFDNVRLPKQELLGEEDGLNRGWKYFREFEWGDWERCPGVFAATLKRVLSEFIRYLKENRLDDRLLSQEPSVRRKIAELATEIKIVRLLSHKIAWAQEEGGDVSGIAAIEANICDRLMVKLPHLALSILGPYGQLQEGSKHAVMNGVLEEMYRVHAFNLFGLLGQLTRKNFIANHILSLPEYHGY